MSDYLEHEKANSIIASCPGNVAKKECCVDDEKKIIDHCRVEKDENKKFRQHREKINESRTKRNKKPFKKPFKVRDLTWKDQRCKKLLYNLRTDNLKNRMEEFEQYADELAEDLIDLPTGMIKDKITDAGAKYIAKVGAAHFGATIICGGGGAAVGSVVPVVGTATGAVSGAAICNTAALLLDIASGIYTVLDTAGKIITTWSFLDEALDALERAKKDAQRILVAANDPDPKKLKALKKALADEMEEAVRDDFCLKARRCKLVPGGAQQDKFAKEKENVNAKGVRNTLMDDLGMGDTRGCCPGQTGHHLIQDAWLQPECNHYDKKDAPTVCVEGANHSVGTHGKIHAETEDVIKRKLEKRKGVCSSGFTMDCAIEVAVEAHQNALGSHCDPTCLEAQLRDYYDKLKCKPRPTDRNGDEIRVPPTQNDTDGGTLG